MTSIYTCQLPADKEMQNELVMAAKAKLVAAQASCELAAGHGPTEQRSAARALASAQLSPLSTRPNSHPTSRSNAALPRMVQSLWHTRLRAGRR